MKPFQSFPLLLLSVGLLLLSSVAAQTAEHSHSHTDPVDSLTSGASPELTDAEMLNIYGWMAGMRAGISRLGLTDEEFTAFVQGIDAARSAQDLDVDLQAVGPQISEFVQAKFEAHMANLKAEQLLESEAYWSEVLSAEGVKQLDSGLAYRILAPGNEVKPSGTDTVRVYYTGKLVDGTVFDTSDGGGPYETELDRVIEGWTQGVPLIGEGGKIMLYIPAELGYGDEGSGRIPPGATLVFEVELLEVVREAPEEETSSAVE